MLENGYIKFDQEYLYQICLNDLSDIDMEIKKYEDYLYLLENTKSNKVDSTLFDTSFNDNILSKIILPYSVYFIIALLLSSFNNIPNTILTLGEIGVCIGSIITILNLKSNKVSVKRIKKEILKKLEKLNNERQEVLGKIKQYEKEINNNKPSRIDEIRKEKQELENMLMMYNEEDTKEKKLVLRKK